MKEVLDLVEGYEFIEGMGILEEGRRPEGLRLG